MAKRREPHFVNERMGWCGPHHAALLDMNWPR
jgi:hypothetical protein